MFRQLELRWFGKPPSESAESIEVNGQRLPLVYSRNSLAKRYRLFIDRKGQPRVTIPRRGSRREAERFVERHRDWLVEQLRRFQAQNEQAAFWQPGTPVLFRGAATPLELDLNAPASIRLGTEVIPLPRGAVEDGTVLRGVIENHLRRLASAELPVRVLELAAQHESPVQLISVRNQRSRWGSCSRRGTVSLNWRLIQAPPEVRDYVILHELMHMKEMNHSRRFWSHVAKACPDYKQCEAWLRRHSSLLR